MTTEPITLFIGVCHRTAPLAPLSAYTEPVEPLSVPSTTCSWPLPSTSASAGLLFVFPLSAADHARLQWLSTAISLLAVGRVVRGARTEDDTDR